MKIRNFVNATTVDVNASSVNGLPIITIYTFEGSCHFQFSMLPEQAREMARALLDLASDAERLVAPPDEIMLDIEEVEA